MKTNKVKRKEIYIMGIIMTMAVGHMVKKSLWRSMKKVNEQQSKSVLMDKLGVETIDEYMRMDRSDLIAKWKAEL